MGKSRRWYEGRGEFWRTLGKAQGCGRLPTLIPSAACNKINELKKKRCVMDNKSFWCESSPLPSPRLFIPWLGLFLFLFSLVLDRRDKMIKKGTLESRAT